MLENKQQVVFRKSTVYVRKRRFYREINAYTVKYWDTKQKDFAEQILLWNLPESTSEI